ncbi:hypothetical protein MHYP_G00088330 [Metynnis hypsauchen]
MVGDSEVAEILLAGLPPGHGALWALLFLVYGYESSTAGVRCGKVQHLCSGTLIERVAVVVLGLSDHQGPELLCARAHAATMAKQVIEELFYQFSLSEKLHRDKKSTEFTQALLMFSHELRTTTEVVFGSLSGLEGAAVLE